MNPGYARLFGCRHHHAEPTGDHRCGKRCRSAYVAVGLHDCYGPQWLSHYPDLLRKLGDRAKLETLDGVANRVTLENASWR